MTFEYAPVTKGLMLGIAATSIFAGIFDVKHYLHLQLVPHITKHHQYWRLFAHHIACASSSDLLLTELLLYNASVHIERAFGSVKFASFILIALMLNTLSTFVAQIIIHFLPATGNLLNYIPPGPTAIMFSVVYQYSRLVPSVYELKIFGVAMTDKVWVYATAIQLALLHAPASLFTACIGLTIGSIYRSDLLQLKGWRVPRKMVSFSQRWIKPIMGTERAARRNNRVFPEGNLRGRAAELLAQDEVITTATADQDDTPTNARPAQGTSPTQQGVEPQLNSPTTTGVVRQWVSELAGAARPATGGEGTVRVPANDEIQTLTAMFPDVPREVILGVLQRSENIEMAAETLLSSVH